MKKIYYQVVEKVLPQVYLLYNSFNNKFILLNNVRYEKYKKENILELKKDDVIGDVKEGDVLVKGKEGKFCLDKALTEKRKKEIEDLMKGMWE